MRKFNFKSRKGVTLISLAFTIVVILILTSIIVYNIPDYIQTKKLKDLQNDIQVIKENVMNYYARYNSVPGSIKYEWSVNADKTYYIVDLQALEALSLTYGQKGYDAYKNVRSAITGGTITAAQIQELNAITDIFVFDVETLDVYYVEGITLDGVTYYTYNGN